MEHFDNYIASVVRARKGLVALRLAIAALNEIAENGNHRDASIAMIGLAQIKEAMSDESDPLSPPSS